MADPAICLTDEQLAAYARNTLLVAETATTESHLSGCGQCFRRLAAVGRRAHLPDIPGCLVIHEVGRGRFGVVYKAWRLSDPPQLVALKVLSDTGPMERNRFEREIAVLKHIDSPWIVKCLDAGETAGARYFLMDYVHGVHLDDYMTRPGSDLADKLRVFERVCRAVAHAHAQGVAHRDLKPRNILIDERGDPHILDFGICAVATADWSSWDRVTITQRGDVIGTLKYMSPEQAWGGVAGAIDERSDIWSLGMMLYEIVTNGQYPYALNSTPDKPAPEALLERIRKELPRLPRLDHLPRGRDLETLLERCLTWEPTHRLASAGQLADDLTRYIRKERIRTRPPSTLYRARRLAVGSALRARWALHATLVAAALLGLAFLTFFLNSGWRVQGRDYTGQIRGAATAAATAHDDVLIVGVNDLTPTRVVEYAAVAGLDGVNESPPSWRGVHARLLDRLVAARPRAVVWDYYFRSAQPADESLAQAILVAEGAGVPVVLAAYACDDAGRPEISPVLAERLGRKLRFGVIAARDMVERPGEFVMAVRRKDGTILPGLALTTLASLLHPAARLEIDWTDRNLWIELLYEMAPGAFQRQRDRLALTTVFPTDLTMVSLRAGDMVGCCTLPLDSPGNWQRRTVAYESLLTADEQTLREWVGERVLIVGDLRTRQSTAAPDRHAVRYGSTAVSDVPGAFLLADAVAGLLERTYVKHAFPLSPAVYAGLVLLAIGACVAPLVPARSRRLDDPTVRRALWATLGVLLVSSVVLMGAGTERTIVYLGMAGWCFLVPLMGSFWIEFARGRHRVLDRATQAIEPFGPHATGTVTLATTPPSTLPAAR